MPNVNIVDQLFILICCNKNYLFLFFGLFSISHSPNHLIASFIGNFVLHNSSNPVINISSVNTASVSMVANPEESTISKSAHCSSHMFSMKDSRTITGPLGTKRIECSRSVRLETWRVTLALASLY